MSAKRAVASSTDPGMTQFDVIVRRAAAPPSDPTAASTSDAVDRPEALHATMAVPARSIDACIRRGVPQPGFAGLQDDIEREVRETVRDCLT